MEVSSRRRVGYDRYFLRVVLTHTRSVLVLCFGLWDFDLVDFSAFRLSQYARS